MVGVVFMLVFEDILVLVQKEVELLIVLFHEVVLVVLVYFHSFELDVPHQLFDSAEVMGDHQEHNYVLDFALEADYL